MEMIKKEWQAIFKNKILLISFIVITFIPILYAAFFLRSVWDPYGKTGDLPVAVVNEDKEVEYNGKKLNIGTDLVEELKENDNLDWNFVSAEEAKKGLEDQKYYMVVKIPADFSENAATVMDAQPKKMNIEYETNGALNYLGEVIGETAMKQLKSEVSQKVTEVYAKAIFDQISEVGDGFAEAADGATKLDDGAGDLGEGGQKLNDGLKTLAESTVTFSDGENTFGVALGKYLEGTTKLDDGLSELKTGVDTLGEKVPDLADGVNQLDDGSTKLKKGINDYTDGVSKLADGTSTLSSNGGNLKSGVNTLVTSLSAGTTQLQSGAQQIADGLSQMSDQLGTQIDASSAQLETLDKGLTQINGGLQSLNAALNAGGGSSADLSQVTGAIGAIEQQAAAIESNVTSSGDIQNAVTATAEWASIPTTEQQAILDAIDGTLSGKDGDILQATGTIKAYTAGLTSSLDTLAATLQTAGASASQLSATVQQLAEGSSVALPGAQQAIGQLSAGLSNVKTALDGQLIPGMSQLTTGLSSLQSGLNSGSAQLTKGMDTYIAGVEQVNAGVQKLNDNSEALNSGAKTLSNGIGTLNKNIPTLKEGVEKLVTGTTTIKSGSSQLVENNSQLMNGQSKLADASHKMVDGSQKLKDGSDSLVEGLDKFKDGSSELASALTEGSEKVNDVHTTDETAKMFAEPNQITQEKYSEVPNYGHALAPYVLSLALYVGCLVFNFIYPIRKIADKTKTAFQWWLSKISVGFVAATGMAVIEGGAMMLLGLEPNHVLEYFIVALVSAYAYMFLIMFLAMAFDNPGRFIAMVMLILQLAGSGGTFPMPLTDKFFKVIHPYLPMTHSIYGFREAISSGLGTITFEDNSMILLIIAIVSQILLFVAMKMLKKYHKDGASQLDDNQKLLDDDYNYSFE